MKNDGWMPIDSAPKDGTFIQLLGPSMIAATPYRISLGRYLEKLGDFSDPEGVALLYCGLSPTHWKPWKVPELGCGHVTAFNGKKCNYCPLCGEKL